MNTFLIQSLAVALILCGLSQAFPNAANSNHANAPSSEDSRRLNIPGLNVALTGGLFSGNGDTLAHHIGQGIYYMGNKPILNESPYGYVGKPVTALNHNNPPMAREISAESLGNVAESDDSEKTLNILNRPNRRPSRPSRPNRPNRPGRPNGAGRPGAASASAQTQTSPQQKQEQQKSGEMSEEARNTNSASDGFNFPSFRPKPLLFGFQGQGNGAGGSQGVLQGNLDSQHHTNINFSGGNLGFGNAGFGFSTNFG